MTAFSETITQAYHWRRETKFSTRRLAAVADPAVRAA
jgi:hypothetical protein